MSKIITVTKINQFSLNQLIDRGFKVLLTSRTVPALKPVYKALKLPREQRWRRSLLRCLPFVCFITVMLTNACGHVQPAYQEPALYPYAQQFEHQYNRSTNLVTMVFIDAPLTDTTFLGDCWSYGTVEIVRRTWETISETQKHLLIYHELGHCVLKRPHRDDIYDDHCPKSIMNSIEAYDFCYDRHKEEMDKELFDNRIA